MKVFALFWEEYPEQKIRRSKFADIRPQQKIRRSKFADIRPRYGFFPSKQVVS